MGSICYALQRMMSFQTTQVVVFNNSINCLYTQFSGLQAENITLSHSRVSMGGRGHWEGCVFGQGRLADWTAVTLRVIKCSFYSHFPPSLTLKEIVPQVFHIWMWCNTTDKQSRGAVSGLSLSCSAGAGQLWMFCGHGRGDHATQSQKCPKDICVFRVSSLYSILHFASTYWVSLCPKTPRSSHGE